MALPWLIGAAVIGVALGAKKLYDSHNSIADNNNCDDSGTGYETWWDNEMASQNETAKMNLSAQFDAHCQDVQNQLTQSLKPYFSLSFYGFQPIGQTASDTKNLSNKNHDLNNNVKHFFDVSFDGHQKMLPLKETSDKLSYIKNHYNVEVKADTALRRALQDIETCHSDFQTACELQKSIQQTLHAFANNTIKK